MPIPLSQEVALASTLRARDDLARAAQAVPDDRRMWRPGGMARSAVWIVAHCGAVNRFYAATIADAPLPYRTQADRDAAIAACGTLQQAVAFLNVSVTAVCDAIVALPEERLAQPMVMPWGERQPVALALLGPSNHMRYHEGQITYIHMLLGDDEEH